MAVFQKINIWRGEIKWPLILTTLLSSLLELIGLAVLMPLLIAFLDNESFINNKYINVLYSTGRFSSHISFLIVITITILIIITCKNVILHYLNNYKIRNLLKLYAHHSLTLFNEYYNLGLPFIKEKGATELSHNVNTVAYNYVFGVLYSVLNIVGEVILAVLIFMSLCFVNTYIALFEVALFITIILFYHFKIGSILQKTGNADNKAKKNQWHLTMETFRGYTDIEINNSFEKIKNNFKKGIGTISQNKIVFEKIKSVYSMSIETGVIIILTIVIIASFMIKSTLFIGILVAATIKLIPSVKSVMNQIGNIRNNQYTLGIIPDNIPHINNNDQPCNSSQYFGRFNSLEVKDLTFAYCVEGEYNDVFQKFDIVIKRGEKIGIKGISGSGKSTLFYLLLGLYTPKSGTIKINGIELTRQNRKEWHKKIGYVSQDVFIMDGTIIDNILMNYEHNEDDGNSELKSAIKNASIDKLIEKLPFDIYSKLGESGSKLSGGERQRIAIARALYKKSEVLMLDEATSALDSSTEADILRILEHPELTGYSTAIIISHRESLLSKCDRVITIS